MEETRQEMRQNTGDPVREVEAYLLRSNKVQLNPNKSFVRINNDFNCYGLRFKDLTVQFH